MTDNTLPLWERFTTVRADEIIRIGTRAEFKPPASEKGVMPATRAANDTGSRWQLQNGRIVSATSELVERGTPEVGDFFVVMPNGTECFIARATFLATHRRPGA